MNFILLPLNIQSEGGPTWRQVTVCGRGGEDVVDHSGGRRRWEEEGGGVGLDELARQWLTSLVMKRQGHHRARQWSPTVVSIPIG